MLHRSTQKFCHEEKPNGQPSTPPDQSQDHEAGPPAGGADNAGGQQDSGQAEKRPSESQETVAGPKKKYHLPSHEELAVMWMEKYDGIGNWIARAKELLDGGELSAKHEFECHLMMLKLMLGTKSDSERAAEQASALSDDEVADRLEQWYQNRRKQEIAEQRERRLARQNGVKA